MDGCRRDLNKAKKKITRCIGILQRDLPGIQVSDLPTKHIFIGNAGLTTNADESSLVELITSVGSGLEALTLLPGKQYSFASFTSIEQAQSIYLIAHGHLGVRGSVSPVYMAYVDRVPVDPSPIKFKYPPGLMVVEEFISPEEETMLMNLIDWGDSPLSTAEGSVLKHRQVRHFGYEFQYSSNSVDKEHQLNQDIPPALSHIVKRITDRGCMPLPPNQLTVNKYLPGQGIPPHVDTHSSFTSEILSLSVGGGVNMDFRYVAGPITPSTTCSGEVSKDKPPHYVVYLPPRSLCVMAGPARYEWSHGICPRMTDVVANKSGTVGLQLLPRKERISFTFRRIRSGECPCQVALICDSHAKKQDVSSENARNAPGSTVVEKNAARLEKDHVLQVYDQIASHFSVTRHKPWPHVLEFVCSLPSGSTLLDVGCGNGKYMGHNKQVFQIGCDTSTELMKICNTRGFEVLTCNCLHLPYRDAVFDAAVCIAVIHHLSTESRRVAALGEMVRVLRRGGRGLVYVWAMEQRRGDKKSTYLKQNNKASKHGINHHWQESCLKDTTSKDTSEEIKEGLNSGTNHSREVTGKPECDGANERLICGKEGSEKDEVWDKTASLPIHINRTEFVQQDMLVPWKLKPPKKAEVKCERRGKCEKECAKYHCCRGNRYQGCSASVDQTKRSICCSASHDATNNKNCHVKSSRKKAASNDSGNDQVFHRYYHVFKQGELEQLCSQLNVSIVNSYYDEGNWCVIFEKVT
ncbi:hypothetical protein Pmani_023049 [Petrolisthes manimaculis]|uniref:Fe2OG dioxygenase domain-containing protein n=1 Tax=Petrolisthes manimaculis TaxID=1843537 RepID=A0AAE1U3U5_9EUCA|nr:hypothetical protein Pmani_023049 [Petrolisthes manimaculis]